MALICLLFAQISCIARVGSFAKSKVLHSVADVLCLTQVHQGLLGSGCLSLSLYAGALFDIRLHDQYINHRHSFHLETIQVQRQRRT